MAQFADFPWRITLVAAIVVLALSMTVWTVQNFRGKKPLDGIADNKAIIAFGLFLTWLWLTVVIGVLAFTAKAFLGL